MRELTEFDIKDILYDISEVSIFFEEPVRVDFPGFGPLEVGNGFGGYHWSLFERGAKCNLCSNCCRHTFRRIWFWWDSEPYKPMGLESYYIRINGQATKLWLHFNDVNGMDKCDFLRDIPGELAFIPLPHGQARAQQKAGCALHNVDGKRIQPIHCHLHPQTGVYKYGHVNLLSRRLPTRNWRWPQCPIDVAAEPRKIEDIKDDLYSLEHIAQALIDIPNQYALNAVNLYKDLLSTHQKGQNHYFRKEM